MADQMAVRWDKIGRTWKDKRQFEKIAGGHIKGDMLVVLRLH